MPYSRRRRAPLAALVAMLVLLAACGGGDGSDPTATDATEDATTKTASASPDERTSAPSEGGDPADRLAAVEQATRDAGSVQATTTVSLDGLPGAGSFSMEGTGVSSTISKNAEMTMEMSGLPQAGQPGDEPITQEVRQVEGTTYLRSPVLGAPTPWVSVPPDARNSMATGGLGDDPMSTVALLELVSGEITEIGTEQVNGVATTHYSFEADLAAAAQAQGGAGTTQQLRQLGLDSVPLDVWLDEENRLRRMEMTASLSGLAPTGGGADGEPTMTMRVNYLEYGADLRVEAPPQDQVTPISELGGGQGAAGGGLAPSAGPSPAASPSG